MRTQYFTATSLDGFIADSDHSLEWLFQFGDGPGASYQTFIERVGAIAMGSHTYEWVLANEIYKDPKNPKPWPYTQPCWIFSSRMLRSIDNANLHFVEGDVKSVHAQMAQAANGANIWLAGGGDLVGQFFDEGLLDDLFLGVAPVLLGAGAPLLPRRISTPPLKLVSSEVIEGSFLQLHYEVQKGT